MIYAFKEGSIRVINQSAKAIEFDMGKPQLGHFQVQDHFKLSNSSKVGFKMNVSFWNEGTLSNDGIGAMYAQPNVWYWKHFSEE